MFLLEDILDEVDEYDFEMLNVGGMKFVIMVSIFIKRDIYLVFVVMIIQCYEKSKVLRDEDGCMFIDWDGIYFRYVFNWFCDGVVMFELEILEYYEIF